MLRTSIALILVALPAAAVPPVLGVTADPGAFRMTPSGGSVSLDLGGFFWLGPVGVQGSYRFPYSGTAGAWDDERSTFTSLEAKAVEPGRDKAYELGGSLGFYWDTERSFISDSRFEEPSSSDRTVRRSSTGEALEWYRFDTWQHHQGVASFGARGGLYHWSAGLDLMDVLGQEDVVKTKQGGSYGYLSRAYLNTTTDAFYAGVYYANFYRSGFHNSMHLYADLLLESSSTVGPVVTASGVAGDVTDFPYHRDMGWRVGGQFTATPVFHMKAEGGYRPGYAGGYLQLNFGWGFMTL